jgi:hypothetical protein
MAIATLAPVATERSSSDKIECRCSRVSVRRASNTLTIVPSSASHSEAATDAMGEELDSDEAAASEYIFLRRASALVSLWA